MNHNTHDKDHFKLPIFVTSLPAFFWLSESIFWNGTRPRVNRVGGLTGWQRLLVSVCRYARCQESPMALEIDRTRQIKTRQFEILGVKDLTIPAWLVVNPWHREP